MTNPINQNIYEKIDWLRAVPLIPNSAIFCYHSANLCYRFLVGKKIFKGKTNMAVKVYIYMVYGIYDTQHNSLDHGS